MYIYHSPLSLYTITEVNNKWIYNCICVCVLQYMYVYGTPHSKMDSGLIFPVNLRLKLSVFDVMFIYKDLRLHDNTLRRFRIQSLLRLELQVRLELGNPIQYLQLSQNLEHPVQISENTFKVHVIQTT